MTPYQKALDHLQAGKQTKQNKNTKYPSANFFKWIYSILGWIFQIRYYIWACWDIKYFSEQQWLWSHEQNICSNVSHRLKRATDVRDCVSALCLQRERNMSLLCMHALKHIICTWWPYAHFLLIVSIWSGRNCLSVWVESDSLLRASQRRNIWSCVRQQRVLRLQGLVTYSP